MGEAWPDVLSRPGSIYGLEKIPRATCISPCGRTYDEDLSMKEFGISIRCDRDLYS